MKKLLTILIVLLFTFQLQAQESRRERIKALKIAYLTEKLDLQPEQASAFWPLYNTYEDELFTKKRSLGELQRSIAKKEPETISETEAKSTLKEIYDLKKSIAATEMEFHIKVPEVLGAKGALLLDVHEELFKRELLKKLQQRRAAERKKN